VLAHRLGLIPIRADPALFEERGDNDAIASNTICFRLQQTCTRSGEPKGGVGSSTTPGGSGAGTSGGGLGGGGGGGAGERYVDSQVLSSALIWVPQGDQATELEEDPPRPVHPDILIAKMRPGQEIHVECWCEKGIGRTHAKWSPVATASYRLLPRITFRQPVVEQEARELKKLCPMDVFDIEDIGGVPTATAARPRSCTVCRECVREPHWAERINLQRQKDHFIFSVESTGAMPAERLVRDALHVLKQKALDTAQLLKDTLAQGDETTAGGAADEEA
jgi:DNA-directed RNA polymerase I and III subunit RPAC1